MTKQTLGSVLDTLITTLSDFETAAGALALAYYIRSQLSPAELAMPYSEAAYCEIADRYREEWATAQETARIVCEVWDSVRTAIMLRATAPTYLDLVGDTND